MRHATARNILSSRLGNEQAYAKAGGKDFRTSFVHASNANRVLYEGFTNDETPHTSLILSCYRTHSLAYDEKKEGITEAGVVIVSRYRQCRCLRSLGGDIIELASG